LVGAIEILPGGDRLWYSREASRISWSGMAGLQAKRQSVIIAIPERHGVDARRLCNIRYHRPVRMGEIPGSETEEESWR
jgi:hypothetical protein